MRAPRPSSSDAWPMFRGNLARTGGISDAPGPASGRVRWTFTDPEARAADFSSSPAVVGDRLYVGCAQASIFDSSGMVYCLDAATGKRIWQFQTEKEVFSSPAVVGGRVYIGEGLHTDMNCKIYCLDAGTGKLIWATATRSHTEASPTVVGNRLYTAAGDDGVYCLDATTGRPIWHRGDMHVDSSPAVADGRVFVGTGYGRLRALALDAETGASLWETETDLPVWGPPSVADGSVFFGMGNGDFVKSAPKPRGAVWRLDAATGNPVWKCDLPDAVLSAIAVREERLFAGCRNGFTYALNRKDGKVLWEAECGGPVVASPALDTSRVYAAGDRGKVVALDQASGQSVWTLDLSTKGGPDVKLFSSPALAGGRLYLGASREKLFCIGE
jgi:outer membrane protein assembly factor BamB